MDEIGQIPSDWEIATIGQVVNIFGRIGYRGYTVDDIVEEHQGAITLSPSNIIDGKLSFDKVTYISWSKYHESPEIKINHGDILLVKTGSTFGKTAYVRKLPKEATLNPQIVVLKDARCVPTFLAYMMGYKIIQDQIDTSVVGGAIPTLSQKQISRFKFPLPSSHKEQKAIATALSDVDALIQKLDDLIQKKENIKKATMQLLLTGKKRLDGFEGEWEEVKLSDVGATFSGLSGKTKADFGDGNHPYIPFLNVINNPVIDPSHFDSVQVKDGESQDIVKVGDLLFNTSSETPEEVGMCSVLLNSVKNLHLNSFCFGFRLYENIGIHPIFLTYYFRSGVGRNIMFSLAQGSTRYNLSKSKFLKLSIKIPPFEEQKAIARLISDMNEELSMLNHKKDKFIKIKKGMMQELLTGKTRII